MFCDPEFQSWCYLFLLCLFKSLYSTISLRFIGSQDLYLYYFLSRYPGRTLVFSNTVDCIRRLGSLFRLLNFDPWVLHASMQQRQRLKNLDRQAKICFPYEFPKKKWNNFSHILNSLVFRLLMLRTFCFLLISFVLLIFFSCFFFLHFCRFKSSSTGLLLATDVAARGLDIPAVEHVIHYQVPKDPDVSIKSFSSLSSLLAFKGV